MVKKNFLDGNQYFEGDCIIELFDGASKIGKWEVVHDDHITFKDKEDNIVHRNKLPIFPIDIKINISKKMARRLNKWGKKTWRKTMKRKYKAIQWLKSLAEKYKFN